MSNTHIIESQEQGFPGDQSLILLMDDDGVISVDQETLHSLILSQSDASVSVVRLSQTCDIEEADMTLTVDPPDNLPLGVNLHDACRGPSQLSERSHRSDPERFKQMGTASTFGDTLKNLGKNITAMLGMLSMEERQNSIRHSIELDHCYTTPSPQFHSETDLQSYFDALSVEKSTFPDVENLGIVSFSGQPELNEENRGAEVERENLEKSCPKIVRQFRKDNLGQKNVTASQSYPDPPGKLNSRSTHTSHNYDNIHQKDSEIQSTDNLFLSSESSGSQSSDSDSDFGPRSCRKQAKTRSGRRTLNARVACSSKYRRRGPNKQNENEQLHLIPPEIVPSGTCEKKRGHRRQLNSLAPKHRDEQCDSTILTRDSSQKRNGIGFLNESEMSGSGEKHNNAGRDHSRRRQSLTQDQRKFESNDSIDIPSEDSPTASGIGDDLQQDSRTSNAIDLQVADEFGQIRYNAPFTGNLPISHEIPLWSSQKDLESSQTTRNLFLKHANFDRINRPPPITEVSDQNKSTRNVKDIRVTEVPKKSMKKEHRKSDFLTRETFGPALFSDPDIIRRVNSVNDVRHCEEAVLRSTPFTTSQDDNALKIRRLANVAIVPCVNTSTSRVSTNDVSIPTCLTRYEQILTPALSSSNRTDGIEKGEPQTMEGNGVPRMLCLDQNYSPTTATRKPSIVVSDNPMDGRMLDVPKETSSSMLIQQSHLEAQSVLLGTDIRVSGSSDSSKEHATPCPGNEGIYKPPLQVMRGGKVITLPPIEAPTTRSKKLLTESKPPNETSVSENKLPRERPQSKAHLAIDQGKKTQMVTKWPSRVGRRRKKKVPDLEYDDEEDGLNSDSEDDPNRLWCICRQPHNNRFMICCDMCQDWFHGKCVQVTKAMGEQMETQGIEWVCPDCMRLKNDGSGAKFPSNKRSSDTEKLVSGIVPVSISNTSRTQEKEDAEIGFRKLREISEVMHCVVCRREARSNSIYCSDACILTHAETSSVNDKRTRTSCAKGLQGTGGLPNITPGRSIAVDQEMKSKDIVPQSTSNRGKRPRESSVDRRRESSNTSNISAKTHELMSERRQGLKNDKHDQNLMRGYELSQMGVSNTGHFSDPVCRSKRKASAILQEPSIIPSSHSKQGIESRDLEEISLVNQSSEKMRGSSPEQGISFVKYPHSGSSLILHQKPRVSSDPKFTSSKKIQEIKYLSASQKKVFHQKECKEWKIQKVDSQQLQPNRSEIEPIRLNVRKTLSDSLLGRVKDAADIRLSEDEVSELALQIEFEMFKFFKDTGAKYKAKYRSLLFNIKDPKNLTLFHKIADRSLAPEAVVKLNPDEMASQELAQWRENETKHQLEMIKKNELDLLAQTKSVVVKTHKGEQIIENDEVVKRTGSKIPLHDIVPILDDSDSITSTVVERGQANLPRIEKKSETGKGGKNNCDESRSRKKIRAHHKSRNKIKKSKKSSRYKERMKEETKSKSHRKSDGDPDEYGGVMVKNRSRSNRSHSKSHHKSRHRDSKEPKKVSDDRIDKQVASEDPKKLREVPPSVGSSMSNELGNHLANEITTYTPLCSESDISDREPTSTVIIKTPDINEESDREPRARETFGDPSVWQGYVHMAEVAKFYVAASYVSGNAKDLFERLPKTLDVVGRISPITVWEYIGKMRKNATKEIIVIKIEAINDEERIPYITLYSYLNSRSRLGVLGNVSSDIKDFYIMPYSNGDEFPSVLQPIHRLIFDDDHHHLLLGIIVVNKNRKRQHLDISSNPLSMKVARKGTFRSMSNHVSPSHISNSEKIHCLPMVINVHPESTAETSTGSLPNKGRGIIDDDDEPYSPGEPVHPPSEEERIIECPSPVARLEVIPGNSQDLQKKVDELSKQIEEEKKKIQSISSSFLGDLTSNRVKPIAESGSLDWRTCDPADIRSFAPTLTRQPILNEVSNITIPPNLQEILANVERQINRRVDLFPPTEQSAPSLATTDEHTSMDDRVMKSVSSQVGAAPHARMDNTEKFQYE